MRTSTQLTFTTLFSSLSLVSLLTVIAFKTQAYDGKPQPLVANESPKELENVGITENLGGQFDLNTPFFNEKGETVTLGSFFKPGRPVMISPVYYSCPGLCNFHLNGVFETLNEMDWQPGQKFEMIAFSFDPKETSQLAAEKKAAYLKTYKKQGADEGIHFLVAAPATIYSMTQKIGFRYKWNEEDKQWAHASAAVIVSPDGVISRYLPGILFDAPTMKMALNEAAAGRLGNLVDRFILYCFHYDPKTSKYALYAFNAMKVGGALTVLLMGMLLVPFWLRTRRSIQPRA